MDQRVASIGAPNQCSGRAVGREMEVYIVLGTPALPERRMVDDAATGTIISRGAVSILWPIFCSDG